MSATPRNGIEDYPNSAQPALIFAVSGASRHGHFLGQPQEGATSAGAIRLNTDGNTVEMEH
ncbi:MAG: hypothetical protein P4M11_13140 [Candidatus Pacebacteria bacterium]|nr:hypothetical protein [Candidatus Paceibacterota bacterium]